MPQWHPQPCPQTPPCAPCMFFFHPALRQVGGEIPVVLGLGSIQSQLLAPKLQDSVLVRGDATDWHGHTATWNQEGTGTAQPPSKAQDNGIQRRADVPAVSIKLLPAPAFRFALSWSRGVLGQATEPAAAKQEGTHAPGQLPPVPFPCHTSSTVTAPALFPRAAALGCRFGAMTPAQFISTTR